MSSVYSRSAGRCAARRSGRKDGGGGGLDTARLSTPLLHFELDCHGIGTGELARASPFLELPRADQDDDKWWALR